MECSINVSDTLLSHGGVFFHIRTVFSCPVVLSVVEGGMMKSPLEGVDFGLLWLLPDLSGLLHVFPSSFVWSTLIYNCDVFWVDGQFCHSVMSLSVAAVILVVKFTSIFV